jgi:hypothetical protein
MEKLNTDKKALRKFGLTMATVFAVIFLFLIFRHKVVSSRFLFLSLLFLGAGFVHPASLRLLYIAWMKLAFVLGWMNTRLILTVMFYLVFTPIAIILKVMRKDLLDRKIERERHSYWLKKNPKVFEPRSYERQF